jgi:putative tryptophan/tyrosine transport system substrate-binding protein
MSAKLIRREFITLLSGAAVAWPVAARAQQSAMPVIGYLYGGVEGSLPMTAFKEGLRQSGYIEGQNLSIEYRWANAKYDQLPALAAGLVRRHVDVIAAASPVAARAAMSVTTSIPIVFVIGSDPVRDGLVVSLNRPGQNITGVTFFGNLLSGKRLELLRQLVAKASVISLLLNPENANAERERNETQEAAQQLGLDVIVFEASNVPELDRAITMIIAQRPDAVIVSGDSLFFDRHEQIGKLAAQDGIAVACPYRHQVASGCLMSYGTTFADAWRDQGIYVGRVLKGERPIDLPVVQPTKFQFVINLATAKALGLSVPPNLLALADEVIE